MSLSIVVWPGYSVEGALPVLLKGFPLPGENRSRLITGDGCSCVVLGGENVT